MSSTSCCNSNFLGQPLVTEDNHLLSNFSAGRDARRILQMTEQDLCASVSGGTVVVGDVQYRHITLGGHLFGKGNLRYPTELIEMHHGGMLLIYKLDKLLAGVERWTVRNQGSADNHSDPTVDSLDSSLVKEEVDCVWCYQWLVTAN